MRDIHWRIAVVAFVVGFCAVAAAALYYANDWWLSGVMSASIVCWLAGVLAAVYGRTEWRPVVIGALAASFLYVLLALGPWFRTNVGPWLLTTRGLAALETKVLGREPLSVAFEIRESLNRVYIHGGYINRGGYVSSGDVDFFGSGIVESGINPPFYQTFVPTVSGPSLLVQVGHWLFGWIAAGIGGLSAAWFIRRREQRETSSQSAPKIHSPLGHSPAEEAA